jgi:hypothetical protein
MAVKEWSTAYSGANPVQDSDPITGVMPDLDDESGPDVGDGDEARTSQAEAPRDKLQTVCKMVGDSATPPEPAGSLCEILDRDHTNGDALQLRLRERASAPSAVANKAFIYAKDDGGVTKVYARLSDGTELELGAGGAAAGELHILTAAQPTTTINISTDTQVIPESGVLNFTITTAGTYKVEWTGPINGSGNTTGQFKLVFDEGEGGEQTIGYTTAWQLRTADYDYPTFYGEITLAAGSHTLKGYGKEIQGGTIRIIGTSTVAVGDHTVVLTLITAT